MGGGGGGGLLGCGRLLGAIRYYPSCIKGHACKHMFTAFACKPQDNGLLDQRCTACLNAAHRRNTATRDKLVVPSTTAAASSLAQVLPKETLNFIVVP